MTYSEIVAAAEYSEQRMHFNNDLHGRPEPIEGESVRINQQARAAFKFYRPPATVSAALACPTCDENRADWLISSEDGDEIECQNCGEMYTPLADRERPFARPLIPEQMDDDATVSVCPDCGSANISTDATSLECWECGEFGDPRDLDAIPFDGSNPTTQDEFSTASACDRDAAF